MVREGLPTSEAARRLVGGAACLDFANSVDWAEDGTPRPPATDSLDSPAALVCWGTRLGLAGEQLELGEQELSSAWELRRAIHDVFAAIATGRAPAAQALARLARGHAEATAAGRLVERSGRWQIDWDDREPRRIRLAVAVDAVDLLGDQARLGRLRLCPGRNCGWLFVDSSGRRRWCTMDVCGSRDKMRRLYERRRRDRERRA